MMISFSLEDVSTFNQYKKQFKIVVNQYNKRYQESIKTSPKKYLNTFFMLGIFAKIYLCTIQYIKHILTDNNYARYIKNFDYGKAKMEIDKKINELKKILPFNTTFFKFINKVIAYTLLISIFNFNSTDAIP